MINNTLTLSKKYDSSSLITKNDDVVNDNFINYLSLEESIWALEYSHSIELKRNKIINDLSDFFEFGSKYDELLFLESNSDVVEILPFIASYIKNNFDKNARLALELMNENVDWQTLFINIHSNLDWKEYNKFIDLFLEVLFNLYPNIAQKLNVNIMPDEF
jgi:hypothetical protein